MKSEKISKLNDEIKLREDNRKDIVDDISPFYKSVTRTVISEASDFVRNDLNEYNVRDLSFSTYSGFDIGNGFTNSGNDCLVINNCIFDFSIFENIKFYGVKFINCSFVGCSFKDTTITEVTFIDCDFSKNVWKNKDTIFMISSCIYSSFEKCALLSCYFNNCNINNAYFNTSELQKVKFDASYMESLFINTSDLVEIKIARCTLRNLNIWNSIWLDIRFENHDKMVVDDYIWIDEPYMSEELYTKEFENKLFQRKHTDYLKNASATFLGLSSLLNDIGLIELACEYEYQSKKIKRLSLSGSDRIRSDIFYYLCGFGERPIRTAISMVVSILFFALIFMFSGFGIDTVIYDWHNVIHAGNIWEIIKLYGHSVFFSVTTFSTVGYGNYVPIGALSSFFAAIEMLWGICLTALFTGCIFRKYVR